MKKENKTVPKKIPPRARAISEDKLTKAHLLDQEYQDYLSSSRDRIRNPSTTIATKPRTSHQLEPRHLNFENFRPPSARRTENAQVLVRKRQSSFDQSRGNQSAEETYTHGNRQLLLWGCNASGQLGIGSKLVGVHFDRVRITLRSLGSVSTSTKSTSSAVDTTTH